MNSDAFFVFFKNVMLLTLIPIVSALAYINPNLTTSHKSLDFGTVSIGESKTMEVLIYNHGDTAIESINYITNCNFNFLIKSNCLEDLKPHHTCFMNITFRPKEFLAFNCSAQISSNNGHLYIPIKGITAKPD